MHLGIAVSCESVSRKWLGGWTDMVMRLSMARVDTSFTLNHTPVVCVSRFDAAAELLKTDAEAFLLVDHDNPPSGVAAAQLLSDLAGGRDVVAGWYSLQMGEDSKDVTLSFGRSYKVIGTTAMRRRPAEERDFFDADSPDIQEVDWTGLGMVMMTRKVLETLSPAAFLPEQEAGIDTTHAGWIWDDIAFCKRAKAAGFRLFVDRRVRLEHLRVRDITLPLPAGEAAKEPAVSSAGTGE